jgi:hypothetical protein
MGAFVSAVRARMVRLLRDAGEGLDYGSFAEPARVTFLGFSGGVESASRS